MFNRFMLIVFFVPMAIVLIALSVANRASTAFTFDPFNPGNPALTIQAPLFVLLFLTLAFGVILGGALTWLKQGRYRKVARQCGLEAESLRQAATQRPPIFQGLAFPRPN